MTTDMDFKKEPGLKQYILQFIKTYKLYLILLVLVSILAGFFEISVDYKIKEIIDTISQNHGHKLGYLILIFVLYKIAYHGLFFVQRLLDVHYKPQILERVVIDIFKRTVQHSMHWFDAHLSGEISTKIGDFQDAITRLITCFDRMFRTIVTILITLVFILRVNLETGLVLGVFIMIYTPIIFLLLKQQLKIQSSFVTARQEAMGMINDAISNIFGIKVIGNLASELKLKLQPAIRNWRLWDYETRKFDAYYVDLADTFMVVCMNAVQIYLLAHLYRNGQISPGSFAFIAMMTLKIHKQLEDFIDNILFNINPKVAQMKSSYAFINAEIDVIDKDDATPLRVFTQNIHFKNVSFAYGKNSPLVLEKFNLIIRPGERIGVVGVSGAGKTTIIKCLLRYFDVYDGAIMIDDQDIRDLKQDSLRQLISVIPQDISLFHRSIMDNLRLANPDATENEIISACIKARIHDDILTMPLGYQTIVGERGIKLSGGQRQRVAIARAILKNAPILILDEATSSLDTQTEELIQSSINELLVTSKATVIAIAHRLSTLKMTDRIIVIEEGKIIEDGSHRDLLAKGGLYKQLWDAQVGGFIGDNKL